MRDHVKITLREKAKHKVKILGYVCSPSFFSLPAASGLSWLGWRFAHSTIPEEKWGLL